MAMVRMSSELRIEDMAGDIIIAGQSSVVHTIAPFNAIALDLLGALDVFGRPSILALPLAIKSS